MGKQRSTCDEAARRAWRVLRLALLWARKGGLLKCRFVAELKHMPKYLKGHHRVSRDNVIRYGEHELSFDETPVIHLRMSRPGSLRFMLPCIKPEVVDFEYDFGDDGGDYEDVGYRGYGTTTSCKEDEGDDDENVGFGDKGIDVKAEEFIAKFYAQMKLQKQLSFQQRQQHHS
ncbi:hypothetical protein RND81_02G005100 [Saponaria officinalis]|uniref:Uncharacterized protein n=1 Tax=Saponaria officinalis TaxID=3572 RepID=A0AAW1MPN4_SAPOF